MKQAITESDWNVLPAVVQEFLLFWISKKGYSKELTFGQLLELHCAASYDLHYEDSGGRTFNNTLTGNEIVFSWDGYQPIDTLLYEVAENIKRRILLYKPS